MSKEIPEKEKEVVCEKYGYYCPYCDYGYIYKDYDMPDDYEEWNCLLTRKDLEKERKNKMKLPEKKYECKHNNELRDYASGWNMTINCVECWCNRHGDEEAKEMLSEVKEAYEKTIVPYYKGTYDCVIEIERLNAEVESEHRLDNFFQDSLEALDKLNIRGE